MDGRETSTSAESTERTGALVLSLDLGFGFGRARGSAEGLAGPGQGPPQGVVASLLDMLGERRLHATWCLAGSAFADAGALLEAIAARPDQEIAICVDARTLADRAAFEAALATSIAAATTAGVAPRSLSFVDDVYPAGWDASWPARLPSFGIVAYRARRPGLLHGPARTRIGARIRGAWQRADDFSLAIPDGARPLGRLRAGVLAVPTSRTLAPHDPRAGQLERLRVQRLQSELIHAAEHGRLYQLALAPEPMDAHAHANLVVLDVLLRTAVSLGSQVGFASANLRELAARAGACRAAGSKPAVGGPI